VTAALLRGAARSVRRSWLLWTVTVAGLIVLTTAFWPAFRDSTEMTDTIAGMPSGVVEALGLSDLSSPEGFLWGNLYALLIPLLMAVAGTSFLNSLTARQEESGHYELLLTQPVSRTAALVSRLVVAVTAVLALGVLVLVVQFAADAVWDLTVPDGRLTATVVLCTLTALVSVGATALAAGLTAQPAAATASGVGIAVGGYVVSALFPLREGWEDLQYVSPWNWALGGEPLTNDTDAWRYLAPLALALVLAVAAVVCFNRRDVYAP
jgi:ABC-2 type transport system permease protein